MPPLQGGLPTLGAFLWTPYAPSLWMHALAPFAFAQKFQFFATLWWASLGGYWLGRVFGFSRPLAFLLGTAVGLSGHMVTLIHAGHLQKVLAIAWIPWAMAGTVAALQESSIPKGNVGRWLSHGALAAFAVGMGFLSGHPQIAYAMIMFVLARTLWVAFTPETKKVSAILTGLTVLVVAGAISAGQLFPGLEMGALSNRADGVSFEEAVETSYPPAEVLEFILPRFLGDSSSVGFGVYLGNWGERLVSDYMGASLLLFLVALPFFWRKSEAWFWLAISLFVIVVGFGKHTPLYGIFYEFWPGMNRFRSPGTFYAIPAVSIPLLACLALSYFVDQLQALEAPKLFSAAPIILAVLGIIALVISISIYGTPTDGSDLFLRSLSRSVAFCFFALAMASFMIHSERSIAFGLILLSAILFLDLSTANRAFLSAVDWASYDQYLAPNAIDIELAEDPQPKRVLEISRETSLAPIVRGRDSMLGYHPIQYKAFTEHLERHGFDSMRWLNDWGVDHIWSPSEVDAPGFELIRNFSTHPGGFLFKNEGIASVRAQPLEALERWEVVETHPNKSTYEFELNQPSEVSIAKMISPGWTVAHSGNRTFYENVLLQCDINLGQGLHQVEFEYRPKSFSFGLFVTSIGLLLVGLFLPLGVTRK